MSSELIKRLIYLWAPFPIFWARDTRSAWPSRRRNICLCQVCGSVWKSRGVYRDEDGLCLCGETRQHLSDWVVARGGFSRTRSDLSGS